MYVYAGGMSDGRLGVGDTGRWIGVVVHGGMDFFMYTYCLVVVGDACMRVAGDRRDFGGWKLG